MFKTLLSFRQRVSFLLLVNYNIVTIQLLTWLGLSYIFVMLCAYFFCGWCGSLNIQHRPGQFYVAGLMINVSTSKSEATVLLENRLIPLGLGLGWLPCGPVHKWWSLRWTGDFVQPAVTGALYCTIVVKRKLNWFSIYQSITSTLQPMILPIGEWLKEWDCKFPL